MSYFSINCVNSFSNAVGPRSPFMLKKNNFQLCTAYHYLLVSF